MYDQEELNTKQANTQALWKIISSAFLLGSSAAAVSTALYWPSRLKRLPVPSEADYKYYNPFDVDVKKYVKEIAGPGATANAAVYQELVNKLKLETAKELVKLERATELSGRNSLPRSQNLEMEDDEENSEKSASALGVLGDIDYYMANYFSNFLLAAFGFGSIYAGWLYGNKFLKKFLDKKTEGYTRGYTQAAADKFYREYADLILLNKKMREGAFDAETIRTLPEAHRKRLRDLLMDYSGLDYSKYLDLEPVAPELRPLTGEEVSKLKQTMLNKEFPTDLDVKPTDLAVKKGGVLTGLSLILASLPALSAVSGFVSTLKRTRKADPIDFVEKNFRHYVDYDTALQAAAKRIQNVANIANQRSTNIQVLQKLLDRDTQDTGKAEEPSASDNEVRDSAASARSESKKRKSKRSKDDSKDLDVGDIPNVIARTTGDPRKVTPERVRLLSKFLE